MLELRVNDRRNKLSEKGESRRRNRDDGGARRVKGW